MLWISVRPARTRLKPPGFILPCQPVLGDRPPSGPEWQHELKWDGYRSKDGDRLRPWARTGTDYTVCLDRIRCAIGSLPVQSAVLDGEAVVFGADDLVDFGVLRSSEGQSGAVMIAHDLLELDGQDIRREPLQKRRECLARLLSPAKGKAAVTMVSGLSLRRRSPPTAKPCSGRHA